MDSNGLLDLSSAKLVSSNVKEFVERVSLAGDPFEGDERARRFLKRGNVIWEEDKLDLASYAREAPKTASEKAMKAKIAATNVQRK